MILALDDVRKRLQTTRHERSPYLSCFRALVIAWVCGLAVEVAFLWSGVISPPIWLVAGVSLASGLIAVIAMMPGFLIEQRGLDQKEPVTLTIGFFAAFFIRLVCTVALVAVCGYQFRALTEQIAGMVIAWYVLLTTVEVSTLATVLTRQHRKGASGHPTARTSVQ